MDLPYKIKINKIKNKFKIVSNITNNNINMINIINNKSIINIIYEINKKIIFTDCKCYINDNEKNITVCLVLNHFFKDFGISQKYIHFGLVLVTKNFLPF